MLDPGPQYLAQWHLSNRASLLSSPMQGHLHAYKIVVVQINVNARVHYCTLITSLILKNFVNLKGYIGIA